MDISNISWLGVVIAAVAAFFAGGVYYGVLGKAWMKAARIEPAEAKMSPALFATSLACEFVMAVILSILITALSMGDVSILKALEIAFMLWLGLVATTQIVNHRYQGFGWDLTLIDSAHWLIVLLVQGVVLGYFSTP